MGMRLSSFFDHLLRRHTASTDDSPSFFTGMSRPYPTPTTTTSSSASAPSGLSRRNPSRSHRKPTPNPLSSKPPPSTTSAQTSTTSPAPATRPAPQIIQPSSQTSTQRLTASSTRLKLKTKVRDFAFPVTDDRYIGLGATAPKASQFPRLNKKLGGSKRARPSVSSASGRIEPQPLSHDDSNMGILDDGAESSDYPEDDDDEDDDRPRIHFGPRFGAFFDDSDSDEDDDDDDDIGFTRPSGGSGIGTGTGTGTGVGRGGFAGARSGVRPGFLFRN